MATKTLSSAERSEIMYHTYIVECADKSFYVGCTNNLEKRMKQHNNSKSGAQYTKSRRPVKLLYSEKYPTIREAMKREMQIKGWKRIEKLALINKKQNQPRVSVL